MVDSVKSVFFLNATPIVMGGSLQASVAFIAEATNDPTIDWRFLISPEVEDQLQRFSIDTTGEKFTVLESPAKNRQTRSRMQAMVAKVQPQAVFTFFGPTYVKLPAPHLMGVADGWITHSSTIAMRRKSGLRAWLRFILLFLYKRHWYKRADRWVVEAECARVGMKKRFFIEPESVDIVSNSYSKAFAANCELSPDLSGRLRILFISAYYPHKNFEIIPQVAAAIKQMAPSLDIEFVITIAKDSEADHALSEQAQRLSVSDYLVNVGPVPVSEAPALYRSCHLVFMPSLLETFSAIYPEAMISGLPIVTTDLDFAHSICQDAAVYYSPLDANAAAKSIVDLLTDANRYASLQSKGRSRVREFPSQQEKYQGYCASIARLLAEEKHVS